ncbi:MAG: hypothetical protein M3024_02375 [Candidatus Dormibacteraeota bacterium]|nr:hypothetical protein [Candidatus Dormibacteraeota bacterium]
MRQPTAKELAATRVLRLPLAEASAKIRSGGPRDDAADMVWPAWAGVIPLRARALTPVGEEVGGDPLVIPGYAASYRRPGWSDE